MSMSYLLIDQRGALRLGVSVALIAGEAHSMVSPSDLRPSSLVSWKTLAAHRAGILIRRPLPSTFVWRSFVEITTPEVVVAAVAGDEVMGSSGGVDLGTID